MYECFPKVSFEGTAMYSEQRTDFEDTCMLILLRKHYQYFMHGLYFFYFSLMNIIFHSINPQILILRNLSIYKDQLLSTGISFTS